MTKCFKDLDCDTQVLNQNTVPISDCQTRKIHAYDCDAEVIEVPILTCEGLWRISQREAEEIVAPGGVLIADPIERNRAINAAYARLWLYDSRFQWAGLAAFASKQVGCGLLHAADSIERDAQLYARDSRSEPGLFTASKMHEQSQLAQIYKQTDAGDGVPSWLPNSRMHEGFQHIYEMMVRCNIPIVSRYYPLRMLYAKRVLTELKQCLGRRASIREHSRFPALWLIGRRKVSLV